MKVTKDSQNDSVEAVDPVPKGSPAPHTLVDFLARLSTASRDTRSKEEIDLELENERDSWES